MSHSPATINKQGNYPYEEKAYRFCSHCRERKVTDWRRIGYDEFGELWVCRQCWDQAIDISHEQGNELCEINKNDATDQENQ